MDGRSLPFDEVKAGDGEEEGDGEDEGDGDDGEEEVDDAAGCGCDSIRVDGDGEVVIMGAQDRGVGGGGGVVSDPFGAAIDTLLGRVFKENVTSHLAMRALQEYVQKSEVAKDPLYRIAYALFTIMCRNGNIFQHQVHLAAERGLPMNTTTLSALHPEVRYSCGF